jgi:hypothetical protein
VDPVLEERGRDRNSASQDKCAEMVWSTGCGVERGALMLVGYDCDRK